MPSYNQITKRIFIGDSDSSKNKSFIKANNIKAVLNCTTDIPNHFQDLEYLRIPVEDKLRKSDYDKFYGYIPVIVEYIHKIVDIEKKNLLVHCWQGMQRSTGAVVAYLMKYHCETFNNAVKIVYSKRKEAFHYGKSVNFDEPLKKYAMDLYKMRKCITNKCLK